MNNIKLTKKNISILALLIFTLVILPVALFLSKTRTALQQKAAGGTGTVNLAMIGPDARTTFEPNTDVPVYIVTTAWPTNVGSTQRVYNFAVQVSATGAAINPNTFTCASPFKKLVLTPASTVLPNNWNLVCYLEGGVDVSENSGLASFTVKTGTGSGSGRVSFVNFKVFGFNEGSAGGVADLTGVLTASTPFNFTYGDIVTPTVTLPNFGAISTFVGSTPTPEADGVDKCDYTVNINWGSDKANAAVTYKTVKYAADGVTVVTSGTETLWCGAAGTYPTTAGIAGTGTAGSCNTWGGSTNTSAIGQGVKASLGNVTYYKLYYKGSAVNGGVVDTKTYCSGVVSTPTATPTQGPECIRCATLVEIGQTCPANYSVNGGVCFMGASYARNMICCRAVDNITLTPTPTIQPEINGYVFNDLNRNGSRCINGNNCEGGVLGVKIQLKTLAGALVAEKTSLADGWYSFTNPVSGIRYNLSIIVPTGYTATTAITHQVTAVSGVIYKEFGLVATGVLSPTPTRTQTPTPTPTGGVANCPRGDLGNLNCGSDGVINGLDWQILKANWATTGPVNPPASGFHTSDIVVDGKVNQSDLSKLLRNWSF